MSDIRAARNMLAPHCLRTPLVRLNGIEPPREIFLKLECLQPTGAFKARCMGNVVLGLSREALQRGVYTASSGNAGLGLAWIARKLGVRATVYAPQWAPQGKLGLVRESGADVVSMPDEEWWQVIRDGGHAGNPGTYVDAVRNPAAMAGNGTIGLEIIEQIPDVDTVIVPFGGGGLACGVASTVRGLKADTRIIVAESTAAAPLTAAMRAGKPVTIKMASSFISGAGAPTVLDEMWPLVRDLVDSTVLCSVAEVAAAVRLLFEKNHVVAEGAGAIALAAALGGEVGSGKVVCVVSGGNIANDVMAAILQGQAV